MSRECAIRVPVLHATGHMREIFEEIFVGQPLDPMEAARRAVRPNLRKRFYKEAGSGEAGEGGWPVLLDGRPVRTPARRPLAAPTRALGQALAGEWNAQGEFIDPGRMPLTRLANAVIDAVADRPQPVADEIARYLGSDLVCYRAEAPAGLVVRQSELWDPLLAFARDDLGARFVQVAGVTFADQPPHAVAAARAHIPADAWRLGAVSSIATLTGSALLALALAKDAISADAAWDAAHLDEDWQMAQWGRDALALERRAFRRAEFDAAATVLKLAR
jgi:chaperone required for assembly of F1-ATPase